MTGKRSSLTLPVEPISPPPKPASRMRYRVTGFGGGAGYRPRVRRAYFDVVYRHSRARRRQEYKPYCAIFKGQTGSIPLGKILNRSQAGNAAPKPGLTQAFKRLRVRELFGLSRLRCREPCTIAWFRGEKPIRVWQRSTLKAMSNGQGRLFAIPPCARVAARIAAWSADKKVAEKLVAMDGWPVFLSMPFEVRAAMHRRFSLQGAAL